MKQLSKAQRTRKFIIEQVAPVFNKQGYAGTALSDIEVVTGLTKGAIYGHFANKDALAIACFDHNISPLQRGLMQAIAHSGSSHEKLMRSIQFYREHYVAVAETGGCPLMNASTEADDTLPFLKEKVQERILSWKRELVALISTGQEQKEFETNIETEQFATSMIAMIEGGILLAKAMDKPTLFYQVLDNLELIIETQLKRKI